MHPYLSAPSIIRSQKICLFNLPEKIWNCQIGWVWHFQYTAWYSFWEVVDRLCSYQIWHGLCASKTHAKSLFLSYLYPRLTSRYLYTRLNSRQLLLSCLIDTMSPTAGLLCSIANVSAPSCRSDIIIMAYQNNKKLRLKELKASFGLRRGPSRITVWGEVEKSDIYRCVKISGHSILMMAQQSMRYFSKLTGIILQT